MPYFPTITDSKTGEVIDFGFLEPILLEVQSDRFTQPLTIRCRFTNHVFSEKPYPGLIALEREYDINDHGFNRQFSRERYECSRQLPAMMRGLPIPGNKSLEQNANGNTWHVQYEMLDPRPGPYHVWLSIRRQSRSRNFGADIEMVVESAYPGQGRSRPNLLGRAKFATVVTNAFLRKPTHTRK